MSRVQAFEIHELPGCPDLLRRIATDYLRTVGAVFHAFQPVAPLLAGALAAGGSRTIIDLCSGGAGPVVSLAERARERLGPPVDVVLTDLYPNQLAFAWAAAHSDVPVRGEASSVDARRVPEHLRGVRTLFDAFHHFPPSEARQILADAATRRTPILVVEATERSLGAVLGMLLVVPLLVLALTPFVRPFSFWRLIFTYLIPIAVPLIVFDGIVSCLRSYRQDELKGLTDGLESDGYRFYVGSRRSRGQRLSYVLGSPGPLPAWALS
jgi:hypothetical protein